MNYQSNREWEQKPFSLSYSFISLPPLLFAKFQWTSGSFTAFETEAESICANNSNLAATTPRLTQIPRSVLTVTHEHEMNMFPLKCTRMQKAKLYFFTILSKLYSETNNTIRNNCLIIFQVWFWLKTLPARSEMPHYFK